MATIEQLERMVLRLQLELNERTAQMDRLLHKSELALEQSMHAYRLDSYGYIWVYNPETKNYHKTNQRVMTPEIAERAVVAKCIAPGAVTTEKIADMSVTGDHMENDAVVPGKIATHAITPRTIAPGAVLEDKLSPDILNQIRSAGAHGYALSKMFGNSINIGICQLTLTEFANQIYGLLEESLGRELLGFTWDISPNFLAGNVPQSVHITIRPAMLTAILEHTYLSVNDVKVEGSDKYDQPTVEYDLTLNEASVVRADVQMLGMSYYREQTVGYAFFLGAGAQASDIMNVGNVIDISNGMRVAHNITIENEQYIYIVIALPFRNQFIRADINGVEIPFTEDTESVPGYIVLKSENAYSAGEYSIDING